ALDPLECDGVHIPSIAGNVVDLLDAQIGRRMEAVIHAGGQAQGDVLAALIAAGKLSVAKQLRQGVREPLGLQHRAALDRATGPHNAVAGADEMFWVRIDRAAALFELANETA